MQIRWKFIRQTLALSVQFSSRIITAHLYFWDVSPDGSKLLFTRHDNPTVTPDNVYVIGNDGLGLLKLTSVTGASQCSCSKYSPDGTKIIYTDYNGAQYDLWIMNADGTGQTPLTSSPTRNEIICDWR